MYVGLKEPFHPKISGRKVRFRPLMHKWVTLPTVTPRVGIGTSMSFIKKMSANYGVSEDAEVLT